MEKNWWKEGVVYQIYPRSFYDSNGDGIGDLPGIIKKLDYLQELGVDIVWLCPVYSSPNDDNGYDISDYQRIMSEFGDMEDMDRLIQEMHRRGIRLIMDLVVNHTSDEHPWFIQSRSSRDNPYRDYYIWRPGRNGGPPNNWASRFGGSAWEHDPGTGEYYLHLFSRKQPDLNWENPAVREEVYRIMTWWLDKGIDGFRMDVINMLSKVGGLPDGRLQKGERYADGSPFYLNGPQIHHYLQEMNRRVLSRYDLMTVGETPGVTPEIARKYVDPERRELNMLFHFEIMYLDRLSSKWQYRQWTLPELKAVISRWCQGLGEKGWNSLYLNNHDTPRMVSRFGNDSIYRVESARMLAALLHTLPGTPYIYQGEEIGMTNAAFPSITDYRDIETLNWYHRAAAAGKSETEIMAAVHRASRDNARTPLQWNDSVNAGFTTGTPWIRVNPNYREINIAAARADQDSIYHCYRQLIRLRKAHPTLIYGDYRLLLPDDPHLFTYLRSWQGEEILIILNFSSKQLKLKAPAPAAGRSRELLFSSYPPQGAAEHKFQKHGPKQNGIKQNTIKQNGIKQNGIKQNGSEQDGADILHLQPFEAGVYRLI